MTARCRGVRRSWTLLLFLVLIPASCSSDPAVASPPREPGALRVATLNVHYLAAWSDRAVASWPERAGAVVAVLSDIDADLFAFQEMETFAGGSFNRENVQMETIASAFPDHRFVATGDPQRFPNTQPILVRSDRFQLLDQGFFYFSATPEAIYSEPWFGRHSSYATWARLSDTVAGERVVVVNLHISNERYRQQLRSAALIVERIAEVRRPGDHLIVLGDFNSFRFMAPVRRVARGLGLRLAGSDGPTFHFYRGVGLFPAIDHILIDSRLDPLGVRTVRTRPEGVWPSDHYPVFADLLYAPTQ